VSRIVVEVVVCRLKRLSLFALERRSGMNSLCEECNMDRPRPHLVLLVSRKKVPGFIEQEMNV